MHNILIKAGCLGTAGYRIPFDQAFDTELPPPTQPIAWLRSVPHNGGWPRVRSLVRRAQEVGYDPFVLVMTRAWWITRLAATKNHTGSQKHSDTQLLSAYLHIFNDLDRLEAETGMYMLVSYDELVHEPRALPALLDYLGLPRIEFEFRNANEKWYERLTSKSS